MGGYNSANNVKRKEEATMMIRKNSRVDVEDDILGDSSVISPPPEPDSIREGIAEKETTMVNVSKVLVVVVIFVVAALVGFIVHAFLSTAEKKKHQAQFDAIADEIISITHIRSRSVFDNLEQVGVSLTAQAQALKARWPFVYFDSWQVQGMISNQITGANTLTIHPLVHDKDREAWERFSVYNQGWLEDAHTYDALTHPLLYQRDFYLDETFDMSAQKESLRWNVTGIEPSIWKEGEGGHVIPLKEGASQWYTPFWQRAPAVDFSPDTNKDLQSSEIFEKVIQGMLETDHPVMTEVTDATFLKQNYDQRFPSEEKNKPHIYLLSPIYDTLFANRTAVGFLSALFRFDNFFINILPETEKGIIVVLDGSCGQTFTYTISGHQAEYVGPGNLRDPKYDHFRRDFDIAPFTLLEETEDNTYCQYSGRIYPTSEWGEQYFTDEPVDFAIAIVSCFVVTSLVFVLYDCVVQNRQRVVLESATKANQVVSSLFPSNVRERLMDEVQANEAKKEKGSMEFQSSGGVRRSGCQTSETIFGSAPIADFFPETTIMFADMVGFTAWSSIREPCQVFTLLETIYHAFDMIARRRRVFKVETIGDCYVAVCGLPVQRADHALVMARFAHETNRKMQELVVQMEGVLGPDTAELAMRTGLHSGPVTAGVLRGDKGRFQLFGDTMNTTARIESTGERSKIHLSQETADLLIQAGKEKWVVAREDKVIAKGKGELQTYWLAVRGSTDVGGSLTDNSINNLDFTETSESPTLEIAAPSLLGQDSSQFALNTLSQKKQRLVIWCVEIMSRLLKQIVAQRLSMSLAQHRGQRPTLSSSPDGDVEVTLELPQFDANLAASQVHPDAVVLTDEVASQLELFVSNIAFHYSDKHAFHSFEHASHVAMTVTKLFSQMHNQIKKGGTAPEGQSAAAFQLHIHSHGITSDPLTQFACVFAAITHDVDHPGLSNATLIKENHPMALRYNNGTSVAERNSLNVTWELFARPEFQDLRTCLCTNNEEMKRFKSTVATLVLATDIMDPSLVAKRLARWEKAFGNAGAAEEESLQVATNRKATLVLEHLIQSADIAHAMQHWHVFLKWNKRLFFEMYQAFLDGHAKQDPASFWYEGEIRFYDCYVIPLAQRLKECGVFGFAGDECLSYALANRREWEQTGQDTVKEYARSFEAQMRGEERRESML